MVVSKDKCIGNSINITKFLSMEVLSFCISPTIYKSVSTVSWIECIIKFPQFCQFGVWEMLLLLLLSRFSRVRLCVTPETAAHQAPPSLGFSRQEHLSGLPFPSPMQEGEKRKWSRSVVSDPQRPHGLQPTRLLHPWDFLGKSTGVGCHCLLQVAA